MLFIEVFLPEKDEMGYQETAALRGCICERIARDPLISLREEDLSIEILSPKNAHDTRAIVDITELQEDGTPPATRERSVRVRLESMIALGIINHPRYRMIEVIVFHLDWNESTPDHHPIMR